MCWGFTVQRRGESSPGHADWCIYAFKPHDLNVLICPKGQTHKIEMKKTNKLIEEIKQTNSHWTAHQVWKEAVTQSSHVLTSTGFPASFYAAGLRSIWSVYRVLDVDSTAFDRLHWITVPASRSGCSLQGVILCVWPPYKTLSTWTPRTPCWVKILDSQRQQHN